MLFLAPLVALLGGALLVFFSPRYARLLALLSMAAALVFTVGMVARPGILLRHGPEETGLLLYAGGPGLILALLVIVIILVSIGVRFSEREEAPVLVSTLLLAAGGLVFLLSHNPLTLYLAWGLLDLSILFGLAQGTSPRTATRAMIINFTAGLALLLSLLVTASSEPRPMNPQLLALLMLLASWVRWGLYPVQMVHIAAEEIPFLSGSALQTVTLATGGYFLTLYEWPQLAGVPRTALLLLAGLALLYGALSTWRNPRGPKGIPWEVPREKRLCLYLAQSQMGLLALGLLGSTSGGQAVLLLTVSLILALSVLRVGMEVLPGTPRQRLVVRVGLGVGIASLCGLPLTAGFAARWLVYDSLLRQGEGLMVGLGALGSALIVAPLLEFITRWPDRHMKRRKGWAPVATLWLLAFPLVIMGLYPPAAGTLLGPEAIITETFPSLAQLLRAPSSLPMWAAIVLPLLLGYLIFSQRDTFVRLEERLARRAGPLWERLSFPIPQVPQGSRGTGILSCLDLEGLYGVLEEVGAKICSGLRGAVMVIEGGSLGWLLLLALVVALFLLRG